MWVHGPMGMGGACSGGPVVQSPMGIGGACSGGLSGPVREHTGVFTIPVRGRGAFQCGVGGE